MVGECFETAVVTGASGMVGLNLIVELLKRGWEVYSIVRENYYKRRPWAKTILSKTNILYSDIRDLNGLIDVLNEIPKGKRFILFHLAAVLYASRKNMLDINFRGTCNILRACIRTSRIPSKIIFTSSILALGDTLTIGAEESLKPKPRSGYEISKYLSENIILRVGERLSLPTVVFRPTWIYGPYSLNMDILLLSKAVKFRISPELTWNPRIYMVYVKEIVKAFLISIHPKIKAHGIYNIAEPIPYTFSHIINVISSALGVKTAIRISLPKMLMKFSSLYADILRYIVLAPKVIPLTRISRDLKFTPKPSLTLGLKETIRWLRSYGLI